jgi:hypothetical protein
LVLERWKWPACHHQQGNCSHQRTCFCMLR